MSSPIPPPTVDIPQIERPDVDVPTVAPGTGAGCPNIPGLSFPELPDLTKVGEIAGEAMENIDSLSERIKNPPTAADLEKELSNKVSSVEEKLKKAKEKAEAELEKMAEELKAQAFQAIYDALDPVRQLAEAAMMGYETLKNAEECLKGLKDSAEAEFNKKSEELKKGYAEGRGANDATQGENKTEEVVNENGVTVKRKVNPTQEESDERTGKTTKTPVPQSDRAIVNEWPIADDPEYRTIGAGVGINAGEFTTVSTLRDLEGDELSRAFSYLLPIFIKGPGPMTAGNRLVVEKKWGSDEVVYDPWIEPDMTLGQIQSRIDEWMQKYNDYHNPHLSDEAVEKRWQKEEDRRLMIVARYERDGEPVPGRLSKPAPKIKVDTPSKNWYKKTGDLWHPASYDYNLGPPSHFGYDPNMVPTTFVNSRGTYRWNNDKTELVKI